MDTDVGVAEQKCVKQLISNTAAAKRHDRTLWKERTAWNLGAIGTFQLQK